MILLFALLALNSPQQATAVRVVTLINAERVKAGCPALTVSAQLTEAAQAHSANMATNAFFDHVDPQGRQPWDRMAAVGYRFSRAAENIAAGDMTPERTVDGWMHSPHHRANILNCALTETGVGYTRNPADTSPQHYRAYWTQDFGTPVGAGRN